MKKLIATILAVIYMVSSTGASVTMHYCMGKLANWGLGYGDSKICSYCGMDKSSPNDKHKSCCTDEHRFFKSNIDQKDSNPNIHPGQKAAVIQLNSLEELTPVSYTAAITGDPVYHPPPLQFPVAIYILHRHFRI